MKYSNCYLIVVVLLLSISAHLSANEPVLFEKPSADELASKKINIEEYKTSSITEISYDLYNPPHPVQPKEKESVNPLTFEEREINRLRDVYIAMFSQWNGFSDEEKKAHIWDMKKDIKNQRKEKERIENGDYSNEEIDRLSELVKKLERDYNDTELAIRIGLTFQLFDRRRGTPFSPGLRKAIEETKKQGIPDISIPTWLETEFLSPHVSLLAAEESAIADWWENFRAEGDSIRERALMMDPMSPAPTAYAVAVRINWGRFDQDMDGWPWAEGEIFFDIYVNGQSWNQETYNLTEDDNDSELRVIHVGISWSTTCAVWMDMYDDDGGWSSADRVDVSSGDSDQRCDLTYSCVNKTWSGNSSVPHTYGTSGDKGQIWFCIQSDWDNETWPTGNWYYSSTSNHSNGIIFPYSTSTTSPTSGVRNNIPTILNSGAGWSVNCFDSWSFTSTTGGQNGYYKVFTRSGQACKVQITPNYDYDLYIYNSSGSIIGSSINAGTASEEVSWTSSYDGYYYIRVYNYANTPGWYHMWTSGGIQTDNYIESLPVINERGYLINSYNGKTNYADDDDYYRFYVNATQKCINASISHASGNDFDLYLYNPSGTYKAGSAGTGTSDAVSFCADATGWWYIDVDNWTGQGYYNFSISLTDEPTTPTLTSPPNNTHFDGGTTVNFDWSDVACDNYRIYIRRTSPDVVDIGTFTTTSSAYSRAFGTPGTYAWRVVAVNNCPGSCGDNWTTERVFYIDNLAAPVGWDLQNAYVSWGGKAEHWDNTGEDSDGCGWLSPGTTNPAGPVSGQYNMRDYWKRANHSPTIQNYGCGPGPSVCAGEGTHNSTDFYDWQISASPNSGGYNLHSAGSNMCYVKPHYDCDTYRMYYRVWLGTLGATKLPSSGFRLCFTHTGDLGPSDYARVYYSINNMSTWTQLVAYSSIEADWTYKELSLSAIPVSSVVHIRFELDAYRAMGDNVRRNYAGWWIDDIGFVKPFNPGAMQTSLLTCYNNPVEFPLPTSQTGGHEGVSFEYRLQERPNSSSSWTFRTSWSTDAATYTPTNGYQYRYMVRRGPSWGYASSYTTVTTYNNQPLGTWTGYVSSNWLDPDNWGQCKVPEAIAVTIPNTVRDPEISASVPNITTIDIQNGATLSLRSGGSLTMTSSTSNVRAGGQLTVEGGTINMQSLRNYGTTDITEGAYNGTEILNYNGTINISGGTTTLSSYIYNVYSSPYTPVINMTGGTLNTVSIPNYAGTINHSGGIINNSGYYRDNGTAGGRYYGSGSATMNFTGTTNNYIYIMATTTPLTYFNNVSISNTRYIDAVTTQPFDINGNFTINSGATFQANGKQMLMAGNWTNNGTFTHGNNTVTFDGNGNSDINSGGVGAGKDFYGFRVSKDDVSNVVSPTGSDMKATGTVYIIHGTFKPNGRNVTFSKTGWTCYLGHSGGIPGIILLDDSDDSLHVAGNLIQKTGELNISDGAILIGDTYCPTRGQNSGEQCIFQMSGGRMHVKKFYFGYIPSGDGSGYLSEGTMTGGEILLDMSRSDVFVANRVRDEYWEANGGTFKFCSSDATDAVTINDADWHFHDIEFGNGTNVKTVTFSGSAAIEVTGNLRINNAATLNANGRNVFITGNWTNNGTFTHGDNTVTFNGSTGQTIGGSSETYFFNVDVTNSSASGLTISSTPGKAWWGGEMNLSGTLLGGLKVPAGTGYWEDSTP